MQVSGGNLVVNSSTSSPFTIQVTGLTAGNAVGVVPGFSPGTVGKQFVIATGNVTGFSTSNVVLNTTSFTGSNSVPAGAGFWLSTNSGSTQVLLNYAPSARYTLTGSASATAIRTGGSTTLSAIITSSTASVTNPDQLVYTGLGLAGGAGTLSSTSGTLAGGASGLGSVSYSNNTAGAYTFTPTLTSGSNLNLGTTAIATATTGMTVTVYNPAAANSISGTINLGTVLKGTSLSQALSITNTAPPGIYSEKLDATFGTLVDATTNSGSISLLAAGGTDSSSMTVGLSSLTAGGKTGSVQVNFASNGAGTSGLSPLSLASQTVNLQAMVLDPATASFTSGSTTTSLLLDFGSVQQNASVSPLGFDFWNLMQTNGYTADLALTSIVGTGDVSVLTTTATSTFNTLVSGSFNPYSVSFANTSTLGSFQSTYTFQFKSANNGTVFTGDTPQTLTLTVQGVIIVPEPGALALAGVGIGLAGWATYRRRRKQDRLRRVVKTSLP